MSVTELEPNAQASLLVEFCGEQYALDESSSIDFGRAATIEIDDNPYLHRLLGRFEHRSGAWWLINTGSRIPLTIKDLTSRSQVQLAPGRSLAISFPEAVVQFEAGKLNYELELTLLGFDPTVSSSSDQAGVSDGDEGATISHADLPLTVDQRKLIVAMAEPTLLTGEAAIELPSNRAAALRLGWTITRFNRKLDNVCERLTKAGVSGLRGELGDVAADRRTRLVEHAVSSGLVTLADLDLLGSPSAER
ncbi:MAG: hypothetical protein R2710_29110 [Acidimicrobiales bacterium]